MKKFMFAHVYHAYDETFVLRVFSDVSDRRNFRYWKSSLCNAQDDRRHPWRTLNLVRKMCQLTKVEAVWTVGTVTLSHHALWDHLKIASCELDFRNPDKFAA